MLEHVKALIGGNLQLQGFQLCVTEFDYLAALDADHVIVMITEVTMLIPDLAIVKPILLCKPEPAHKLQSIVDEILFEMMPVLLKPLGEFCRCEVVLGLQKHLQDVVAIFEVIYIRMGKQLLELFFFLRMNLGHSLPDIRI